LLSTALLITTNASAVNYLSDRIYAGIGLTQSDLQLNDKNVPAVNGLGGAANFENNGFGMDVFAGFKFDDHLALEMGYVDLGSANLDDGTTVQEFLIVDSVYLDAVLRHSVSSRIDVFAKVGISAWSVENVVTNESADGEGVHYGAGFDVNLYGDKARAMRIKWDHHEFDNLIVESTDSVSVSMLFNF
ncbi:MAG: outer membrane beta-barrel protein, partial [Gammaproteobacteria bacterium]|nr:outer membrane beta-barrel protein [Gammaproteobacteria bacterium]